jgi:hypothetical protein
MSFGGIVPKNGLCGQRGHEMRKSNCPTLETEPLLLAKFPVRRSEQEVRNLILRLEDEEKILLKQ